MSASECADLQGIARTSLVSLTEQPAGPDILPPLSGKLSVDGELKLSNEKFQQTINDFFKDKDVTPLSQLKATPTFPTPHVLAQFASKTYTDYKTGETDAQYETQLASPAGWKLLTTASKSWIKNGYFGAAYWHPENQQVVIAHRGTDPTNLGALLADIKGVLLNDYVGQMESASTFAYEVVEVLQAVHRMKGVSFQLFFTGHSLGGWLAQITTFTMKYLKIEGKTFLKSDNTPQSFHPHTVVFDSPGCKDMLSQMRETFDVRQYGRSINIEHLDISSYLSAPNRINTCHSHVGTVYRIFTDLSGMDRLSKKTALYNLATHSMDKIAQAFDPKTGQVHRDEKGELKVQVVVDWPICGSFKRGKEYKKFFEWAQHFNNYHPDIKAVSFQDLCLIRYQTKIYSEQVNSCNIFSDEEQEFLQSYHWLRQWAEFFKPKELFSEMEDNQAQEEAEKMLQSFEIGNDRIHCEDASALQALIAFVKRLLQLFPQIKQNTKSALFSDEIRKRVYRFETRRSLDKIKQSPLGFNSDASGLRDFLRSDHQQVMQVQVVDGDEWTGLIKVYQVLQKNRCLAGDQYTVLKLSRLLTVNHLMDFSTLMHSTVTPHLLLMACEHKELLNEETKEVICTIFDTIKKKPDIKIILSTRTEGSTLRSLQQICGEKFGTRFVITEDKLKWSDLTTVSQEKLLQKSVTFQGAKISLNELVSAESPVANFLSLGALLEGRELKIADPVPIYYPQNEGYYIRRTLSCQRAIKQDIFSDKDVKEFHVYLVNTEQEFEKCCELNPKSNVHWLQKDKSGKILWQQSQGSLEKLREYIDTDSSHKYAADDLDKLLEQAEHQRVMLISDTAGMGKSTILTHLSKQMKQELPVKWVVRIDLNDHTDALMALQQKQIANKMVIDFVSEALLKLKAGLEMELFKQCCEQKQKLRIVIMLDGFDEISPFYKETVIDLLQALREMAVEQLWVTTRPHLRYELEDKLQQLSYTLEPIPEKNQVEFLTEFWSLREWFTKMDNKEKEESKKKLEIYAEELIKKMSQSIGDRNKEFTGFPLQCRMLGEAFDEEVKTFCGSVESMSQLPFQLNLLELYGAFIERKYDIYQEEKFRVQANTIAAREQRERDLKYIREDHQLLALQVLFTEEQVKQLQSNSQYTFSPQELARIGIAEVNCEGKLQFIHHTFAEYYVADFFENQLSKGTNPSLQEQVYLLKDIFVKAAPSFLA